MTTVYLKIQNSIVFGPGTTLESLETNRTQVFGGHTYDVTSYGTAYYATDRYNIATGAFDAWSGSFSWPYQTAIGENPGSLGSKPSSGTGSFEGFYAISSTIVDSSFDPSVLNITAPLATQNFTYPDPYDAQYHVGSDYYNLSYPAFQWRAYPYQDALTILSSDKAEVANVPLSWSQQTGGLLTPGSSGQIHFSDTSINPITSAAVVGTPAVVARDIFGNAVTLNTAQISLLSNAFSIVGPANTSGNLVDWSFSYSGKYYDLDFLAGKTVTVTNNVKISDQNGLSDVATVTNTLSMPAYAGVDYRYMTASDPLVPADIKSAGINMVGEYLGGGASYLTKSKANALTAAGLSVFSIYEHAGMDSVAYFNSSSYTHGVADTTNAIRNARRVGQTPGSAIYFGVDVDPASFQGNYSGLLSYFSGIASVVNAQPLSSRYAVGIYGGGDALQVVKDNAHLASYSFLAESTKWLGSKTYTGWNIEQIRDASLIESSNFSHSSSLHSVFNDPSIGEVNKSKGYIAGDIIQGSAGSWSAVTNFPSVSQNDLNGDNKADLVWQNNSGQAVLWQVDGSNISSAIAMGPANGASWSVKAVGDLDGDGRSDLIWGSTSGQAAAWLMNGATIASAASVGPANGGDWHIAGVGDLSGTGKGSIVWTNPANGQAVAYQMDGTNLTSANLIGAPNGAGWTVAAVADFDGDGKADLAWDNINTGQAAVFLMDGTTIATASLVGGANGADWSIKGAGDIDGDGLADLVWQNSAGQAVVWLMNNTSVSNAALVGPALGSSWRVGQVIDYNGDGASDLILNSANGQAVIWQMNGLNIGNAFSVGQANGQDWRLSSA